MLRFRPSFDTLENRIVPSTFHPDNPGLHTEHAAFLDLVSEANVSYEWIVDDSFDRDGDGVVQYSELGTTTTSEPLDPNVYYLEKWFEKYPSLEPFLTENPFFAPIFVSFGPQTFGPVPEPETVLGEGPQDGDDLWITAGTVFELDTTSARLGVLRNNGSFTADPVQDLTLYVDTFANLPEGAVTIRPTTGSFQMVFTDSGPIDVAWDPTLLSRGFISHGTVDIQGAAVPTWGPLGTIAGADAATGLDNRGGSQVAFIQGQGSLSQTVDLADGDGTLEFWAAQRGSHQASWQEFAVLLDGATLGTFRPQGSVYEKFTVHFSAAAGMHTLTFQGLNPNGGDNTVLLDNVVLSSGGLLDGGFEDPDQGEGNFWAFAYAPAGSAWSFSNGTGLAGPGSGFTQGNTQVKPPEGFTHYEANLDRNVVFSDESTDPARSGHVIFMHGSDVKVVNALFEGLGRTVKTRAIGADNPVGRYALHVHHAMGEEPVLISGVAVKDPTSLGIVSHSSNVSVQDSVVVNAVGAAFVLEQPDGIGDFTRNLAISSTGSPHLGLTRDHLGDVAIQGSGFHLQGKGVDVIGNVVAHFAHSAYFVYPVAYQDHTTGEFPPLAEREGTFQDNLAFGGGLGLFHYLSGHTKVENFQTWNVGEGAIIRGASTDFHGGRIVGNGLTGINYVQAYAGYGSLYNVTVEGWVVGVSLGNFGDTVVEGGHFDNVVDISLSHDTWWGSNTTILRNVGDITLFVGQHGQYPAGWEWYFYGRSSTILWDEGGVIRQVYGLHQDPDFVLFSAGPYAGLTNQEIYEQYGLLPQGAIAPDDAERVDQSVWGFPDYLIGIVV